MRITSRAGAGSRFQRYSAARMLVGSKGSHLPCTLGGGPREKPCRASGRSLIDRKRGPAVHRFELVSYAPRAGFRVLAVIGLVSCAVRLRAGFTKFEREQPGKCRFAHDRPLPGVDPLGESR